MERFERLEKREESPETKAHQLALEEVGDLPMDASSQTENKYWDRYYEAYYSHLNDLMEQSLYIENNSRSSEWESVFDFNDSISYDTESVSKSELEEMLSALETLTARIQGRPVETPSDKKTFFRHPDAREEVFTFSKAIAEYIKKNDVKDLVIADRSSRPLYVGVMEYWKKAFPNERMPGIFFVNPKGFKSKESHSERDLNEIQQLAALSGDRSEIPKARSEEEIIKEFQKAYPRLMNDKEESVLIFDTCIHSGDTLASVVKAFKSSGFKKLIVGSVTAADNGAKVQSDFYITTRRPEGGCYPFDRDRMIEKTFEHVYSKPTKDVRKRELAVALREEIKDIMKERFGNMNLE